MAETVRHIIEDRSRRHVNRWLAGGDFAGTIRICSEPRCEENVRAAEILAARGVDPARYGLPTPPRSEQ